MQVTYRRYTKTDCFLKMGFLYRIVKVCSDVWRNILTSSSVWPNVILVDVEVSGTNRHLTRELMMSIGPFSHAHTDRISGVVM
jgi:hypothetical protein